MILLKDINRSGDSELIHADGSIPFAADQSMGGNQLTNVADPAADQDAATKKYVDDAIAANGDGDVIGPASSTDNAIPRYDSTTGKLLQGSGVTISDQDKISLKSSYCPIGSGTLVSSTVTFDLNTSNYHTHTLTGDRTGAITNASDGQAFQVDLIQDATGGRAWTWWSGITWMGGTPTVETGANKRHSFGFRRIGSGQYLGYDLGHN